jgi:hypothetical protein
MKKKEGITIKINLSNRWIYFLITLGILSIIGVGVYSLTPGTAPNPGHLISEMAPPSPCTTGQVLYFDGTNWKCATGLTMDTSTIGYVKVGTPTTNPTIKLEVVNGYIKAAGLSADLINARDITGGLTVNANYIEAVYAFRFLSNNGRVVANTACNGATEGANNEMRKCYTGSQTNPSFADVCRCRLLNGKWEWKPFGTA